MRESSARPMEAPANQHQVVLRLHKPSRERPDLPNLLFDRSLGRKVTASQADLRRVVCAAAELGIPIPAFMVSLAYFDGYRSDWRPANPSAT